MDSYRRTFERTYKTGPRCRLHVENRSGMVSVRGHDGSEALIRASVQLYADSGREADEELQHIEQSVSHDGESIEIRTPPLLQPPFFFFGRGAHVDFEIRVPKDTTLSVDGRNGRVEVHGILGTVTVENRNGAVEVVDAARPVRVVTRNGRVSVIRTGAEVDVKSTNGPVSIERPGGRVTVEATNGPLAVRDAASAVELRTVNGPISYRGEVAGDLDVETVNGPIRLELPRNSRFEIDAESRLGPVWSDLPVRSEAAKGNGAAKRVRLRSVRGPIHIAPL